jgi:asparagine synthase (glutamine-hydrolysing)
MCGIAGYLGTARISEQNRKACLAEMKRRGPDSQDFFHSQLQDGRELLFLHSRLSIIDLGDRANQPYREGPNLLCYNGELYNYLELRAELKNLGYGFQTESDTEVLAKALSHWGMQALERCEGMWAFAWFDENKGQLWLSRDRFGEKPLYIYRDQTGLYFASEVKFIQALLGKKLKINYNHLYRYLVNGYKSLYKTHESFFHGIAELPAAQILAIDSQAKEHRWAYWMPTFEQIDDSMSYQEAVSGTRERLIRAMQLRLRSDVPLAFCMSGGVDSNSLISIASRELGYDVHGFTIMNTDERYEEQELVELMVRELSLKHTSLPVQTDHFLARLRTLIRHHDAPVYTITYFAHWLLQEQIAKAGYKISVSGTAADELFSGYFDHHQAYLRAVSDQPELHSQSRQNWQDHILPVVRNPFLQDPELFIKSPFERGHIYLNADEFSGYLHHPWRENFQERFYHSELLRNRMLNELFHEATPVILHEDDLNAMFYSIENRSPFLDRELFEWSLKIPTQYLLRDGMAKAVLRDAMRGIVPDPVLDNRRKVGFNAPIFDFLDIQNPEIRNQLLSDSPVFEHLDRDKIINLIDKAHLPNSESKFLFNFLNAKLFLEEFDA